MAEVADDVRLAMKDVFEAASRCGFLEEAQLVHREIERLRAGLEQCMDDKRQLAAIIDKQNEGGRG